MAVLRHKIDFVGLISVIRANPNGDPAHSGRPRIDSGGYGIISPVCIRRKLRDRLAEMGENILITPPEYEGDVLAKRAGQLPGGVSELNYSQRACAHWFDVRTFGQVFTFPEIHAPGVKGAVSIQPTVSADPVKQCVTKITCCISGSDKGSYKQSVGYVNYVEYGLYILRGSVSAYAAIKNSFTEDDSVKLRQALVHIFDNDGSALRPVGTLQMKRLYWWEHNCAAGQYSSTRVFDTVTVEKIAEGYPANFEDYRIIHTPLNGLSPEIYED